MVLLHLLLNSGYNVSIAHCNFRLRGKESDDDANFVKNIAVNYSVPCFIESFETWEYARARKISVQMAARELRYEWLEQIRTEHNYSNIAIAHNCDDNVETLIMNLVRGTGIKGLAGIPVKNGNVIRPLLFAKREEISGYAKLNKIEFREDSSNSNIKYRRNYIRHKIIPLLNRLNPAFIESTGQMIENFKLVKNIYISEINRIEKESVQILPHETRINIDRLKKDPYSGLFMHEFLSVPGFSPGIISQILKSFDAEPGKLFFSSTHRLIKDRKFFILTSRDPGIELKHYIDEDTLEIFQPLNMQFELIENNKSFNIPKDSAIACLDYHLLHFPLVLRKWQAGDYFQPFGMDGLKKLSDFFIDNKLSLLDKENTWIMTSGNKIVWVVGYRIDGRFKISSGTSQIWTARLNPRFHSLNPEKDLVCD